MTPRTYCPDCGADFIVNDTLYQRTNDLVKSSYNGSGFCGDSDCGKKLYFEIDLHDSIRDVVLFKNKDPRYLPDTFDYIPREKLIKKRVKRKRMVALDKRILKEFKDNPEIESFSLDYFKDKLKKVDGTSYADSSYLTVFRKHDISIDTDGNFINPSYAPVDSLDAIILGYASEFVEVTNAEMPYEVNLTSLVDDYEVKRATDPDLPELDDAHKESFKAKVTEGLDGVYQEFGDTLYLQLSLNEFADKYINYFMEGKFENEKSFFPNHFGALNFSSANQIVSKNPDKAEAVLSIYKGLINQYFNELTDLSKLTIPSFEAFCKRFTKESAMTLLQTKIDEATDYKKTYEARKKSIEKLGEDSIVMLPGEELLCLTDGEIQSFTKKFYDKLKPFFEEQINRLSELTKDGKEMKIAWSDPFVNNAYFKEVIKSKGYSNGSFGVEHTFKFNSDNVKELEFDSLSKLVIDLIERENGNIITKVTSNPRRAFNVLNDRLGKDQAFLNENINLIYFRFQAKEVNKMFEILSGVYSESIFVNELSELLNPLVTSNTLSQNDADYVSRRITGININIPSPEKRLAIIEAIEKMYKDGMNKVESIIKSTSKEIATQIAINVKTVASDKFIKDLGNTTIDESAIKQAISQDKNFAKFATTEAIENPKQVSKLKVKLQEMRKDLEEDEW